MAEQPSPRSLMPPPPTPGEPPAAMPMATESSGSGRQIAPLPSVLSAPTFSADSERAAAEKEAVSALSESVAAQEPLLQRRGSERSLRHSGSLGRLRSTTSLLLSPTNRLLHHRLAQERASGKIQAAELAAVQHELKVRPHPAPPGRLSLQPYGLRAIAPLTAAPAGC